LLIDLAVIAVDVSGWSRAGVVGVAVGCQAVRSFVACLCVCTSLLARS
jgi:hypothetical protein